MAQESDDGNESSKEDESDTKESKEAVSEESTGEKKESLSKKGKKGKKDGVGSPSKWSTEETNLLKKLVEQYQDSKCIQEISF